MDLSNYFYQCGLQLKDLKYLGTIHPYKGLRIYTCDPQGLKGASERSYEKLVRIFGDMVQNGQLAQMADGLHVLGDSIAQLATNYVEVLSRAEDCGLTFKPSKVIVCPRSIKLFGWELRDHVWYPTAHTISALANAQPPTTVKKMRSFLGSFKQLSASLPDYAKVVHSLEQLVGGKASAERIVWTDDIQLAFDKAKALATHPKGIAEPRPEDQLSTYSDYSAESRAVGGRLMITRTHPDSTTQSLVGGFFSVILDRNKQRWLPCEGEAAAVRLVLDHFSQYIRESNHPTIHYTDSQACVLAWKRLNRGAFSSSSRISAFLTGLSVLPVELRHKPGRDMHTSDFASRNPITCNDSRCQICSFANDWQNIGDNALSIRSLSMEDIKSGKSIMPMIQKNVWKNIQMNDPIHTKLLNLIETRQLPETKKTKGDHTKLKLLHNLYCQGKLIVDDGLILVKTPGGHFHDAAISVPPSIFPGIAHALHVRLDHPSKGQLASLLARYFYTPGWRSVIDQITDACHQCIALRKLPKVLIEDTHTPVSSIASRFSADVIEREAQKILIVREHLSQFTRGLIIPDQTADTLKQALISLVIDLIPNLGTEIRVDGAAAFQSLEKESCLPTSTLGLLGIKITVGRVLNKNKNPCAENAVQEIQKEILRLKPNPGPITPLDLQLVLRNVNARVRYHSLTPKEVLFRRDIVSNNPIDVSDTIIIQQQEDQKRISSESSRKNKLKVCKPTPLQEFRLGDLVMIRDAKSKIKPRETLIIERMPKKDSPFILIRKLNNSLRSRLYQALPEELILVHQNKTQNVVDEEDTPAYLRQHPKTDADNPEHQVKRNDSLENHLSHRPQLKAAQKATERIRHSVAAVQDKKTRFKYGWVEEDQMYDDYFEVQQVQFSPYEEEDPQHDSDDSREPCQDTTSSNSPQNDDQESSTGTTSEEDLLWDSSPSQFRFMDVQPRSLPDPWTPQPFLPTSTPCLPPAFPRERIPAFTQPPLSRSNAFRQSCQNDAFLTTPTPPTVSPRSRIPVPTHPSQVNLAGVNDVSMVLPPGPPRPRHSSRPSRRPNFLGVLNEDKDEGGRRADRPRKC